MGWKGDLVDIPLGIVSRLVTPRQDRIPDAPSILVFRSNDIGDLLVTTPLFDALRRRFPQGEIVAAVGRWNLATLQGNPHLSEVVQVNAPWNNKYVEPQGWLDVARFIASSPELEPLAARHFDIGIDVVGSHIGSALMMRLGIPWRLGVRGYRGGHTATRQFVQFNEREHVGRSALRFAELLGATELPEVRPQIFLDAHEYAAGEGRWSPRREQRSPLRVAMGVGAGFPEKCWPEASFAEAIRMLLAAGDVEIALLGGGGDRATGARLAANCDHVLDLTGQLSLRESFGTVAAADAVMCNPSMLMHVAAAFSQPTVVVLGTYFPSGPAHDSQWGYPDTCVSLGRHGPGGALATPAEVVGALRQLIESVGH